MKVLSLGAGLQSSVLYLMSELGEVPPLDCAIFADTQAEPAGVYETLWNLAEAGTIPIMIGTQGNLERDCIESASGNARSSNPPLFTGTGGMLRRKCTGDYKIKVIRRVLRDFAGLPRTGPVTGLKVEQWLGITTDEAHRMKPSGVAWIKHRWPLIELGMSRNDCEAWLRKKGLPIPQKSACVFCPYRSDASWQRLKEQHPQEFQRAAAFDDRVRAGFSGCRDDVFLHRSLVPLREVDFTNSQLDLFGEECAGICGT